MSGLPTLLRKNFVVPPAWMSASEKKKLEETVSIDFVLKFIGDRIPKKRGDSPTIEPQQYGDKVIVLKSDTGSGKSTVLPAKLYETFFEQTQKNIAVTQPRVLTAVDTPKIIVSIPNNSFLKMDTNIGYTTEAFKRLPREKGIIFSTVGVISQQLIHFEEEKFMDRYQFVIIDEVHERDISTDLCLFLLKKLLQKNWNDPNCPLVILTSATFDETIFMNYFNCPPMNYIQIVGKTFPIEPRYPEYNIRNVVRYATELAKKVHIENLDDLKTDPETGKYNKYRDMMIFVHDTKTAETIYEDLLKFNSTILHKGSEKELQKHLLDINENLQRLKIGGGEDTKYYILPIILNSKNFKSSGKEYRNLFSDLNMLHVPIWKSDSNGSVDLKSLPFKYVTPTRRIIIGTNVAETGVTIESLKYCIDTGYKFNIEFQPNFNCMFLNVKNITKGSAIQRKGRVGRKSPGIWYPCYTEDVFNNLVNDTLSEIIVSDPIDNLLGILIKEKESEIVEVTSKYDIKNNIIANKPVFQMYKNLNNSWYKIKNLYKTDIESLDFIELPTMQSLYSSLERLHILGYIDDNYDVTALGYLSNKIRFINMECRKMIMAGYHYGAYILDLITISAFVYVSKRNVFSRKFKMENFLKISDAEFKFYNLLLVADDFINSVFIWNIFQKFIESNIIKQKTPPNEVEIIKNDKYLYANDIEKWCEEHGILFDGFMQVIGIRDTIIENLITIGLDPYKNSMGLIKSQYNLNKIFTNSFEDGIDEIVKIKNCIYEGFKNNLIINTDNTYKLNIKSIPITVRSNFINILNSDHVKQQKPKYLVVSGFNISKMMNSSMYELSSNDFISVLDGYINIDTAFPKY